MRVAVFILYALLFSLFFGKDGLNPQIIVNKTFGFELTIPNSLIGDKHSGNECDTPQLYYDTTAGVILMISGRPSIFEDIKSYLDCSKEELEKELQNFQGDTSLRLVECRISPYYPANAILLHFETAAYPSNFNRCLVYFFHYKNKEVQFFFLYNKANAESLSYIDKIMRSLILL
ncbi:MAG: hypothetical protein P4L41_08705 [Flavipsychrobacter sp.]|nr:hypothetical protein [Flavipsychrobacter sp.]